MKWFNRCLVVTATLTLGWILMIWTQMVTDMPIAAGIVGIPSAMILMAFLAIMAMRGENC